jgi:UDP-4-amino-4,6-dideoxy-N-acetyl-beta-L-altrosamine transaminase
MIPYGRQSITPEDIEAVTRVLQSDFLTQGPQVPAFEAAVASAVGAPHAVAVNSATSALHLGCLALDIGPGDRVWTSPNSFVASANCALYCGATIDFVDIDPVTFNLCPKALEAKLERAERDGTLPSLVIPVHLTGQPCDMPAIAKLAQRYGFKVMEDASHAIGASLQGEPVGNTRWSDIAVFSFHPVKIVTTGEGGVATTNDPVLAERLAQLRSHGITRDPDQMTHAPDGPWYYQQIALGLNYRMTELQAALGVSQMERLDSFIADRCRLAETYTDFITASALPLQAPAQLAGSASSWHLYVIQLTDEATRSHREIFEDLRAHGLGANLHYIPIHTQPYYRALGFGDGDFPNAEDYYRRSISIPLYHGMSDSDQQRVMDVLTEVVR